MANFDLISEDDFFSGEKKAKPEKPLPEKPQPEEDLFSQPENEDIFSADELTDNQDVGITEESPTPAKDFNEDLNSNFDFSEAISEKETVDQPLPDIDDAGEPEFEPEQQPEQSSEYRQEEEMPDLEHHSIEMPDYYDDKQDRINYKPFVWGVLGLIVIVALFFVGKIYFFSNSQTASSEIDNPAEPAKTETTGPSPEEVRRTNFFNKLAASTNESMSDLNSISQVALKQGTLSSVLFYGQDLTFEVFAKKRDALAKLNIGLKNSFKKKDVEVVSSQTRPGSKGGVLGVYKINLAGGGSGSASGALKGEAFSSLTDAKNWLTFLVENEGLKINDLKTRAIGNKEGFKVNEIDVAISGSRDGNLKMIKALGAGGKNVRISKLSLNARDQQNFNSRKYQLRLILQVYM